MLAVYLAVPFVADALDEAAPPWQGFAVALLTAPAVVVADALQKVALRRRRDLGPW